MQAWLVALFVLLTVMTWPDAAASKPTCTEPLSDLFRRVSSSVVFISAIAATPFQLTSRINTVIGSGLIIDPNGLVLTNSHVVYGHRAISVTLDDGSSMRAKLLGADPILDLAVLRIPVPPTGLPRVTLGDSEALQVGEQVVAIGNPLGLEQTLTTGVVSGLNRVIPEFPLSSTQPLIQTDTAINPGNSGGPLFNRCGEVIGITSSMLAEAQNIGFAVPSNLAKHVVPQLVQQGHVVRLWLGINGKFVDKELQSVLRVPLADGVLVETVEPGSPAERAGLHEGDLLVSVAGREFLLGGDIVTAINGQLLDDPEKFAYVLQSLKVGETVRLNVYHKGKTRKVEFRLPQRPILPSDIPSEERRLLLPLLQRYGPRRLR